MLESIAPQVTTPAGLNGSGFLPGLDLMASIQILLIQDCDDQLRHLANTMKAYKNVKQAYRKDIQVLQQALLGTTVKIDKKEYVKVDAESKKAINAKTEYVPDPETGNFKTENLLADSLVAKKSWKQDKDSGQKAGSGTVVEKDKLQQKIEMLNQKLESFNEMSELTSLQLQTLTNQRKVCFEALSNLVSKEGETLSSIVRNMKG